MDGDISGIYNFSGSLKLGYNTNSFFSFINVNFIAFAQNGDNKVQLNDDISTLNIVLGYRFDPPKKVKDRFEIIHQKNYYWAPHAKYPDLKCGLDRIPL